MERKIESLLRLVGDMKQFEDSKSACSKRIIRFASDELSEKELDLVAAAKKESDLPRFPWDEEK